MRFGLRVFSAWFLAVFAAQAAERSKESLHQQVFGKRVEREQSLSAELDLNGQALDPIEIRVKGNRLIGVNLSQLSERMADVLQDNALGCLQKLGEEAFALPDGCGIGVRYDAGNLQLYASIESSLRRVQSLQVRPRGALTKDAKEAKVSAYLNVSGSFRRNEQTLTQQSEVRNTQSEEHGFGFDGALRAFGATLEFDGLCAEGRCLPGLRSLVYDRPEQLRRWRVGDLTEARAGSFFLPAMRGLGVGTSFDLAPTESFTPNLDTPLELGQAAKVEVLVNGRVVQRYDLPAGRYQLSEFPLGFGSNAAELRITDAAGRVESRFIEAFVDLALLDAGRVRQTFSVGQTALPVLDGEVMVRPWMLAADYSRGLGPRTTLGLAAASIPELQQHRLELNVTQAWGPWLTGAVLGCGQGEEQGCRADLRWRLADGYAGLKGAAQPELSRQGWQHEGAIGWRQAGYAELLNEPNQDAQTYQAQWRSSCTIRDRHQLTLGARGRWSADAASEYIVSAQWASRLGRGLSLRIGLEQASVSGSIDRRVNLSVNWLFDQARQSLQVESDSEFSRHAARWQFNRQNQRGGYIGNLGAARSDLGTAHDGAIAWRSERAGADMAIAQFHAPDGPTSRDTRLTLRSALVFADGVFGITEKVLDGFAVVKPRDSDASGPVYVNPVENDYLASSLGPGPAVVANLRAYEPRSLALSLPDLPLDRDPGNVFPVVRPGYKGGVLVMAGGEATIGLQLLIVDAKGTSVSMIAGQLQPLAGGEPIAVFVGRDGRLRAQGLKAGDWLLTLQTRPVRRHTLSISSQQSGNIDLGTLSP